LIRKEELDISKIAKGHLSILNFVAPKRFIQPGYHEQIQELG